MKYQKIDNPDEVARQALNTEAKQKEEIALSKECQVEETKALFLRGLQLGQPDVDKLSDDAKAARREANIYVAAAELTPEEIKEVHRNFLHRWLEHTERAHIQHSAVLKVKKELGEPSADSDSQLSGYEIAHDLAEKKLAELEGKKLSQATRRSTPRQRK